MPDFLIEGLSWLHDHGPLVIRFVLVFVAACGALVLSWLAARKAWRWMRKREEELRASKASKLAEAEAKAQEKTELYAVRKAKAREKAAARKVRLYAACGFLKRNLVASIGLCVLLLLTTSLTMNVVLFHKVLSIERDLFGDGKARTYRDREKKTLLYPKTPEGDARFKRAMDEYKKYMEVKKEYGSASKQYEKLFPPIEAAPAPANPLAPPESVWTPLERVAQGKRNEKERVRMRELYNFLKGQIDSFEKEGVLKKPDRNDFAERPSIQSQLSRIQRDISSIESDVSSIQSDVLSIESDVSSIESDVSSIKWDVILH